MKVVNFSGWICCFVVAASQLFASSCHGQDKERDNRIAKGKIFLNSARLAKWESHFTRSVHQMGRIEYQTPVKMLSECWIEGQFFIAKLYHGSGVSEPEITIVNEKYSASIRKKNGVYHLEHVGGPKRSSGGYTTVPVTLLPFAIPSSAYYYSEVIPTCLIDGRVVIDDYRQADGRHYFTFVFTDESGRQPIDMVFDEKISSHIPVETTFHFKNRKEVLTSFEFTEVNGYLIPLKFSCVEEGGKNQNYTIRTDFYPDDRLDREKCYLSFYGLPEPPTHEITDFGRRGTNIYLMVVIVAIFLLLISFAIHRFRRSQR